MAAAAADISQTPVLGDLTSVNATPEVDRKVSADGETQRARSQQGNAMADGVAAAAADPT